MSVASSQTAFCPHSLLSAPVLHLRSASLCSPDMAWWLVASCCLLGQAGCGAAECNATPQLNFAYCHLMPKLIFYKTRKNILHIPLIIQGWSFPANVRYRNRNLTRLNENWILFSYHCHIPSLSLWYANKINLIWIFSPTDSSPEIDIEMKTNTENK